jgi:hypothetical protein
VHCSNVVCDALARQCEGAPNRSSPGFCNSFPNRENCPLYFRLCAIVNNSKICHGCKLGSKELDVKGTHAALPPVLRCFPLMDAV